MAPRRAPVRRPRGLTLLECLAAVAVVGILAAAAVPSQLAQLQRGRRLDAVAALTKLQIAQESYRARYGRYAAELAPLGAGERSPEGLYRLAVAEAGADAVTLIARASADGAQHGDGECLEITLRLNQGLADAGPSGRCWNR